MTITNVYLEKVKRMSDEALMETCEYHGRVMETAALSKGGMTKEDKVRAVLAFHEASERAGLAADRDMLLVALRVLRLL